MNNSPKERFSGRLQEVVANGNRTTGDPLTLLYTIIDHWQKRYPFRIPFIDKWFPLHKPSLELFAVNLLSYELMQN